jgi:hypothetical protein
MIHFLNVAQMMPTFSMKTPKWPIQFIRFLWKFLEPFQLQLLRIFTLQNKWRNCHVATTACGQGICFQASARIDLKNVFTVLTSADAA